MFLEHGDLVLSTSIRECLDNGEPFDTNALLGRSPSPPPSQKNGAGDVVVDAGSMLSDMTLVVDEDKESTGANSMIDVLVAFLECLPEPIIPTWLYERALEAGDSFDSVNNVRQSKKNKCQFDI